MTDQEIVLRKLAMLREHVERVRRRRGDDAAAFLADVDRQDALGMSFLVAVQEAVDIAFHVATDEGWGLPGASAEGFEILARHGVIDTTLAHELALCIRVRNRIAHGYASVEVERLWRELPAGLDALEHFAAAMARFLGPR